MTRYLLDTNVLSEPTKQRKDPEVMRRLADTEGQCVTAAPVWHELWHGCRRLAPGRRRRELEGYLADLAQSELTILPYDTAAALEHSELRALLEPLGIVTAPIDGQIASIARSRGLTVVTRNVRHFEVFPGLPIENWFSD